MSDRFSWKMTLLEYAVTWLVKIIDEPRLKNIGVKMLRLPLKVAAEWLLLPLIPSSVSTSSAALGTDESPECGSTYVHLKAPLTRHGHVLLPWRCFAGSPSLPIGQRVDPWASCMSMGRVSIPPSPHALCKERSGPPYKFPEPAHAFSVVHNEADWKN